MAGRGILGLDEVGRGALAGPVVVGAVLLDCPLEVATLLHETRLRRLVDSKKLSPAQRERVFVYLQDKIVWAVGQAKASEIDEIGLGRALRLAAGRAIDAIQMRGFKASRVEADASLFHPYEKDIPTNRTVKGDETILEITLASIMAKVWRDQFMQDVSISYPRYGFERNVGYGTAEHLRALRTVGISDIHRRCFLTRILSNKTPELHRKRIKPDRE